MIFFGLLAASKSFNSVSLSNNFRLVDTNHWFIYLFIHSIIIFSFVHLLQIVWFQDKNIFFYILGPAFLDENVSPRASPIYLGIWFASTMLGPGLGFVIGSSFLKIFTNIKQVIHYDSFFYFPQLDFPATFPLREKCPCSDLFWSVFSRIRTEYGPE